MLPGCRTFYCIFLNLFKKDSYLIPERKIRFFFSYLFKKRFSSHCQNAGFIYINTASLDNKGVLFFLSNHRLTRPLRAVPELSGGEYERELNKLLHSIWSEFLISLFFPEKFKSKERHPKS